MSRLYGPSEPRSQELWVDVAEANKSQVKVHRILSNTHRQASVSAPVPGSTAWAGRLGEPTPSGQWAWLWPKICDLGDDFQGIPGGLIRVGVPTNSPGGLPWICLLPALFRQAWGSVGAQPPGLQLGPSLLSPISCREWSCPSISLSMGILCGRSP